MFQITAVWILLRNFARHGTQHNVTVRGLEIITLDAALVFFNPHITSHLTPKCARDICMSLDIPYIQEKRTYFTLTQIKDCHSEYAFKKMSLKHRAP